MKKYLTILSFFFFALQLQAQTLYTSGGTVSTSANGMVGVGTVNPERNFQVDGGSGGSSMMLGSTTAQNRTSLWFNTEGSTGHAYLQSWWAGVNQGVLAFNPNGGNVGVGTFAPADQFEVVSGNRKVGINTSVSGGGGIVSFSRGDGAKTMLVGVSDASGDPVLAGWGGSTEMRLISGGGSSSGFGFYTNVASAGDAFAGSRPASSSVMKINGGGSVLIGKGTTPERNLQIDGGAGGTSVMIGSTQSAINRTSLWLGVEGETGKTSLQSWWAGHNQGMLSLNPNGGNVGVGTFNPDAALAVNGTVHAKEVKVDLIVPGPDYVFEKSYDLPSLAEVESYVDENKHLPEVPSAKEMEKNGINVSEMNMLLLKKVEELTLYVISQQKQIDELTKTIKNK